MTIVVVDGRTDAEKLNELLEQPEQRALEHKSTLDLKDTVGKLDFVKDAVAMANTGGGYILIGIDDDSGQPCLPSDALDRASFDAARLNDQIRSYTQQELNLVRAIHEIGGHAVVLIFVPPTPDTPVPMTADGQYEDANKKKKWKFRTGEVPVRASAQNVPLHASHWPELLARHDEKIKQETRRNIDSLVQMIAELQRSGSPTLLPLDPGLAEAAFVETLVAHLESERPIQIRTFVMGTRARARRDGPDDTTALDQLTIIGAQAILHQGATVTDLVIDTLHDMYRALGHGHDDTKQKLNIIDRVYVLGSCAVRLKQWPIVRLLTLQDAIDPNNYTSWIREGQVAAARNDLFVGKPDGLMISSARLLTATHPGMRPDLPTVSVEPSDHVDRDDELLNSLCQFDILYCIVADTESRSNDSYPASAAFNQRRINPVLERVVTDPDVRRALLPNTSESDLADALQGVLTRGSIESRQGFSGWMGVPIPVEDFIQKHRSKT